MATLESSLSLEQLLDNMHRLSDVDQRALAAAVLNDRRLEAFVEELDDQLACEKATEEGPPQPFAPEEFSHA
jgi:predicted transcriptional regulator